jgi:hypothetical protein
LETAVAQELAHLFQVQAVLMVAPVESRNLELWKSMVAQAVAVEVMTSAVQVARPVLDFKWVAMRVAEANPPEMAAAAQSQ